MTGGPSAIRIARARINRSGLSATRSVAAKSTSVSRLTRRYGRIAVLVAGCSEQGSIQVDDSRTDASFIELCDGPGPTCHRHAAPQRLVGEKAPCRLGQRGAVAGVDEHTGGAVRD